MDPVKVAGVAEWPEPTNKREVQSFLGFANFYQRFIQDFSHHARPLFNLTRNDQKWKWEVPEAEAFRKLKEIVTSAPVLTTPADNQPFHIEADSSDFATGAVLSQLSAEDGKWHLVAYLSKSAALFRRSLRQVRYLDGPQELGILHIRKKAQPQTSTMVTHSSPFRLCHASPTRKNHGKTGCS